MDKNKTVKYLRAKQLAQHLGIGLSTDYWYNKQGKIESKKIRGRDTVLEVAKVEKVLTSKNDDKIIKDSKDEDIHNKSKTIEILEKKLSKYESMINNQKKIIEILLLNQELVYK